MKIIFALALVSMIFTTPAFASITDVKVDDHNVLIHDALVYTINGGEISSVTADLDFISLIFQVSVLESEAEMSITFERSFFDAKIGDDDDEFFILADGEEIAFEEEKTNEKRILSFSIPQATEEFEIIGTILLGESFLLQLEQSAIAGEKAEKEAKAAEAAKLQEQIKQAQIEALEKAFQENWEQQELDEAERLAVLEAACGEGTIFEDGECIAVQFEALNSGPLINSIFAAMGIGLAVMIILWGIGKKRGHKKLSDDEDS